MGICQININFQCYLLTSSELVFYDRNNFDCIVEIINGFLSKKSRKFKIFLGKDFTQLVNRTEIKHASLPEAIIFHRYCWHAIQKIMLKNLISLLERYPISIRDDIIAYINLHQVYDVYHKLKEKIYICGIIDLKSLPEECKIESDKRKDTEEIEKNKKWCAEISAGSFKSIYTREDDINMDTIKIIANYLLM